MCCYRLNVNPVVGMFHFCLSLKYVSVSSVSEQGLCIIFLRSMLLLFKSPVMCVYPIEEKITVSVYVFSVVYLCLNKVYWGYRWHLWLLRVAESKWNQLLQMGEWATPLNTEKNNCRDTLASTQTWSYQPLHINLVVVTYCHETEGFKLNTLK